MAHSRVGGYTKYHLNEVKELCQLRLLYDMPCKGCAHEGLADCPKVRNIKIPEKGNAKFILLD